MLKTVKLIYLRNVFVLGPYPQEFAEKLRKAIEDGMYKLAEVSTIASVVITRSLLAERIGPVTLKVDRDLKGVLLED